MGPVKQLTKVGFSAPQAIVMQDLEGVSVATLIRVYKLPKRKAEALLADPALDLQGLIKVGGFTKAQATVILK